MELSLCVSRFSTLLLVGLPRNSMWLCSPQKVGCFTNTSVFSCIAFQNFPTESRRSNVARLNLSEGRLPSVMSVPSLMMMCVVRRRTLLSMNWSSVYHQVIDWVSIHHELRLISPSMTAERQNVVSSQPYRQQSHAIHQSRLGWLIFHRHHLVAGVFCHLQVFINTVRSTLAPLDIPLYFG